MKILVIADIHGNAEALAAVLRREHDAESTIFLGDAILSGPQPNETMALLKKITGTCIMGNHDIEMLEPERFADWPPQWLALNHWILDHFDPVGYEFLRELKPAGEYVEGGIRMHLHHGVLPDNPRNALPDSPDERLLMLAEGSDCPIVLFGHSHIQFRRTVGGQEFINPGSVGQNRCGQRVACYGVFENGKFRHCQTVYDQQPWLDAMDRISSLNEFPDFREWLKQGLITGYGIGQSDPWIRFAAQGYV